MNASSAAVARPLNAFSRPARRQHLGAPGSAAAFLVGRRHAHGRRIGAQHGVGRQHRSSRSKSPSRDAARKALTSSRFWRRSFAARPRRARGVARGWRAVGRRRRRRRWARSPPEDSRTGHCSNEGEPLLRASMSRTTAARAIASANANLVSGVEPAGTVSTATPAGARARAARAQHVQTDARDDVVSQPPGSRRHHVRATDLQPGLLHGVVDSAGRAQHPVRHARRCAGFRRISSLASCLSSIVCIHPSTNTSRRPNFHRAASRAAGMRAGQRNRRLHAVRLVYGESTHALAEVSPDRTPSA